MVTLFPQLLIAKNKDCVLFSLFHCTIVFEVVYSKQLKIGVIHKSLEISKSI